MNSTAVLKYQKPGSRRFSLLPVLFFSVLLSFLICESRCQQGPNDFNTDAAMDIIGIREGMIIGEAGAGRGFFTFPMAGRVGSDGIIYANDIKENALQSIRSGCTRRSVSNITTVLGEVTDPLFPARNLDLVVVVHAFHDFDEPLPWLKNVRKYLRPGGSLAILDRDPHRYGSMHYHFLSREEVLSLLKEAGFKTISVDTSLPNDNIYIAVL